MNNYNINYLLFYIRKTRKSTKLIELTPTAAVVASGTTAPIEITGLSLSTGYSSLSKVIKVKTSADTNASGITISGL